MIFIGMRSVLAIWENAPQPKACQTKFDKQKDVQSPVDALAHRQRKQEQNPMLLHKDLNPMPTQLREISLPLHSFQKSSKPKNKDQEAHV